MNPPIVRPVRFDDEAVSVCRPVRNEGYTLAAGTLVHVIVNGRAVRARVLRTESSDLIVRRDEPSAIRLTVRPEFPT